MSEGRHVAIIGAGAVGVISAIEALREGHRVTLIDAGEPGGEQAASYGNAGWLSSHSVIPPAEPGIWKKVPGWLLDPLGPLTIRWSYLPKALPWFLAAGRNALPDRVRKITAARAALSLRVVGDFDTLLNAANAGDLLVKK